MVGSPILAPVCRSAEFRDLERSAASLPLMERAGEAAAAVATAMCGERGAAVLVLAGPGNNGGDAFVVARRLREAFFDVVVAFRGNPDALPRDAAAAYRKFVAAGGATVPDFPGGWRGTLIVDGLFGIGLTRPPRAAEAALIERANASGTAILALDVPSGLDADTGTAPGPVIRAHATATFIALKPGLLTGAGLDLAGEVSVHALGLDPERLAVIAGHRLDWDALAAALPAVLARRARNVHKGTFGSLGILGGATGMVGAPILAGRAAIHAGVGKVWIGLAAAARPAVDWSQPELMLRTAKEVLGASADARVCGPGLGIGATAKDTVAKAISTDAPLVLDADALNVVAKFRRLMGAIAARRSPTIATPHPAEAARLLGVEVRAVEADRLGAALALAERLRAAVVVKGAGSVLAYPGGTWDINATGNPGLASGGTGDVLAGFAGALLAQGLDAKTALRYAVCVHGAAADACVRAGRGPLGLTASELAPAARSLLNGAAAKLG